MSISQNQALSIDVFTISLNTQISWYILYHSQTQLTYLFFLLGWVGGSTMCSYRLTSLALWVWKTHIHLEELYSRYTKKTSTRGKQTNRGSILTCFWNSFTHNNSSCLHFFRILLPFKIKQKHRQKYFPGVTKIMSPLIYSWKNSTLTVLSNVNCKSFLPKRFVSHDTTLGWEWLTIFTSFSMSCFSIFSTIPQFRAADMAEKKT